MVPAQALSKIGIIFKSVEYVAFFLLAVDLVNYTL